MHLFVFTDFRHNITVQKEETSPYHDRITSPESPVPQSPNHPPRLRAIACKYRIFLVAFRSVLEAKDNFPSMQSCHGLSQHYFSAVM